MGSNCPYPESDLISVDHPPHSEAPEVTQTAFCEQCGATIAAASTFCTECGAQQTAAIPADVGAGASSALATGATAMSPATPMHGRTSSPAKSELPTIAGLPTELWLVIAAFALPGAWILFEIVKVLPDSIKAIGAQFYGFRLGLAATLILVMVGLFGAAMVAIAWKLYHRDRVGRGLAYAFAGTIIISVLFSDSRTSWETWAMIFSIAGVAILAFSPRVRLVFNQSAQLDGAPTSVVVSRTGIAIFSAIAILVAIIYLLLATVSGKYVVAALVAGGAAIAALRWSKRLTAADRDARRDLSIGGAAVAILLIVTGQSTTGLLLPLGLIVSAIACLWLPNDARAFFGDAPITTR